MRSARWWNFRKKIESVVYPPRQSDDLSIKSEYVREVHISLQHGTINWTGLTFTQMMYETFAQISLASIALRNACVIITFPALSDAIGVETICVRAVHNVSFLSVGSFCKFLKTSFRICFNRRLLAYRKMQLGWWETSFLEFLLWCSWWELALYSIFGAFCELLYEFSRGLSFSHVRCVS